MDNKYISSMIEFVDNEIERLEDMATDNGSEELQEQIIMLYQSVEVFRSMFQDRIENKNAAQRLGVGCSNFYNALADYRNVIHESIESVNNKESVFFSDNNFVKSDREKLLKRINTVRDVMDL